MRILWMIFSAVAAQNMSSYLFDNCAVVCGRQAKPSIKVMTFPSDNQEGQCCNYAFQRCGDWKCLAQCLTQYERSPVIIDVYLTKGGA